MPQQPVKCTEGHKTSPAARLTPLISGCAVQNAAQHPYAPVALRCDLPPSGSAFHVNIVCNDTLSEHTCYYGLPTKQRSSLPPRPKEGATAPPWLKSLLSPRPK